MEGTGFWYMGKASDGLVTKIRPGIESFLDEVRSQQPLLETLGEWSIEPDKLEGPTSPLGQRLFPWFADLLPPEEVFYACAEEEIDDQTWDLSETERPQVCSAAFAAVGSVPPVLLLYAGLGPERARRLPGAMGVFALTPDEVAAESDTVRHAHALPPVERAEAVRRMHRWLAGSTAAGFPVGHLLEALPLVMASAVDAGKGLVAATARG